MINTMLKELPSSLGKKYISGVLKYCLPTSGEPLLASMSPYGYFALVPDDLPEMQVLKLGAGGILPSGQLIQVGKSQIQETPNLVHDATSAIRRRATSLRTPLLLAHEAQLNEIEMKVRGANPEVIDGQLYWVFDGDWDSVSDLDDFIKKSMLSWHFM